MLLIVSSLRGAALRGSFFRPSAVGHLLAARGPFVDFASIFVERVDFLSTTYYTMTKRFLQLLRVYKIGIVKRG